MQGQRPRTVGSAAAAEALDFRAFIAQQAALEAASLPADTDLQYSDANSQVRTNQQAANTLRGCSVTPAEAAGGEGEPETEAPGTSSGAASNPASSEQAERRSGTKAYDRLYAAAMTSQRRKLAFAKAAAAAEVAALHSALPRAMSLPSSLYEAHTPRTASEGALPCCVMQNVEFKPDACMTALMCS